MKKPSVVYFDLDRTLIDTTAMIAAIQDQLVTDLGWSLERVQKISQEYVKNLEKSSDFELNGIISAYERAGAPRATVEAAYSNPYHYRQSVYPEVVPLLVYLSKLGIPSSIFSEGNTAWQEHKLEHSGLASSFPEGSRLIFKRKTEPEAIAQLEAFSLLIDDTPEVLRQVRAERPDVYPVWIERPGREQRGSIQGLERISQLGSQDLERVIERAKTQLEELCYGGAEHQIPTYNSGDNGQNQRRNRRLSSERED